MTEMGTQQAGGAQVVTLPDFIRWLDNGNSSVLGNAAKSMVGVAAFAPKLALGVTSKGLGAAASLVPIGGGALT
eukprot:SAG22_NODE_1638_length_3912_cov_5.771046_2_plen_74_part_00